MMRTCLFCLALLLVLTGCGGASVSSPEGLVPPEGPAQSEASPPPEGPVSSEEAVPSQTLGTTETFTRLDLELQVSNVRETRNETMLDDGGNPHDYSVYVCYPGAEATVLHAGMSDPAYSADHLPHPQWAFDAASPETPGPIDIVEALEPVEITNRILGVYNKEASLYVLLFEMYEE